MKNFFLWARQYSKQILNFMLTAWAVGAVYGMVYEIIRLVASPETASLSEFYSYLGIPLTCGIPAYLIPNMFLNREKVRKGYDPDYDEKMFGDRDMTGEGIGEDQNESMKGEESDEIQL